VPKFDQLDTTMDGRLSFEEFRTGIAGLAKDATAAGLLTNAQISALGLSKDATLTSSEALTRERLQAIFAELDVNGDGHLSKLELIRTATAGAQAGITGSGGANDQLFTIKNLTDTQNALLAAVRSQTDKLNNVMKNMQIAVENLALIGSNDVQVATGSQPSNKFKQPDVSLATGGWAHGPGTSTSDSIAARLSNGEFVVKADAAASLRPFMADINRGRLPVVPSYAANDNGSVLAELRALRAEVTHLRATVANAGAQTANAVIAKGDETVGELRSGTRKSNETRRMVARDTQRAA
jgi:hypothetical protein